MLFEALRSSPSALAQVIEFPLISLVKIEQFESFAFELVNPDNAGWARASMYPGNK